MTFESGSTSCSTLTLQCVFFTVLGSHMILSMVGTAWSILVQRQSSSMRVFGWCPAIANYDVSACSRTCFEHFLTTKSENGVHPKSESRVTTAFTMWKSGALIWRGCGPSGIEVPQLFHEYLTQPSSPTIVEPSTAARQHQKETC